MRRHRRDARVRQDELNITAFINLMVILLPFLLISAVFPHLTILEIDLPASGAATPGVPPELRLEISIRADVLEVGDRRAGWVERIPRGVRGHDHERLAQVLRDLKSRFPHHRAATIRSEPDTPYQTLIEVMDTTRAVPATPGGAPKYELFPDIAIADATAVAARP